MRSHTWLRRASGALRKLTMMPTLGNRSLNKTVMEIVMIPAVSQAYEATPLRNIIENLLRVPSVHAS